MHLPPRSLYSVFNADVFQSSTQSVDALSHSNGLQKKQQQSSPAYIIQWILHAAEYSRLHTKNANSSTHCSSLQLSCKLHCNGISVSSFMLSMASVFSTYSTQAVATQSSAKSHLIPSALRGHSFSIYFLYRSSIVGSASPVPVWL